jgi:hypothetical protein
MGSDVSVLLAGLGGSLIGAGATLGGVLLTGRRSARAAQAERRLQAYADLLVAAGEVLGTYRRFKGEVSSDSDHEAAERVNARMADLAAALHQASAVVALTGSDLGRQQGKDLYRAAREVAQSRMRPTDDAAWPWDMTKKDDETLEKAIDAYKDALVPETTALP